MNFGIRLSVCLSPSSSCHISEAGLELLCTHLPVIYRCGAPLLGLHPFLMRGTISGLSLCNKLPTSIAVQRLTTFYYFTVSEGQESGSRSD